MDDDRSRECPHPGREIADGCLRANEAHSGGEVTGGLGDARPTHSSREISVEVPVTEGASLAAREVTMSHGMGVAYVRVDNAVEVRRAGVNGCGLQQESSFGFSMSKRLRYGSAGPVACVE
jgi:hypothetical protein